MAAAHEAVDHGKEYVRDGVHTNTLEGFFSVFKRGMVGTYQHCGEQHLQRYLAEFDFRANHRIAKLEALMMLACAILPCKASPGSASPIGGLTQPKTIRQQAMGFILWRRARGYEVTPFRREFWGRKKSLAGSSAE